MAISYFKEDQIAVLTDRNSSILVFFKPPITARQLDAVKYYQTGEYEKSEQEWIKT